MIGVGIGIGDLPVRLLLGADTAIVSALFAASQPGVFYDTSDLSTMFVDTAGTTPASVGQPVGLLLDKRLGLVRGSELAPNTGTALSGWTISETAPASITSTASGLRIFSPAGEFAGVGINVPAGSARYEVTYTIEVVSGQIEFRATPNTLHGVGTTTRTVIVQSEALGINLRWARNSACEAYVRNVSIKELPGNHASQATTSAKPILRQHYDVTGVELVSPINFQSGWAFSGATVTFDSASTYTAAGVANVFKSVFEVGKSYSVTINATHTTTGLNLYNGPSASPLIGAVPSGTTKTFEFIATSTELNIRPTAAGSVTINSISVKEATANGYYLQFDGVDDFLRSTFTIAQPWDRISAIQQISWTTNDLILNGVTSNTGYLQQTGVLPNLAISSGININAAGEVLGQNQIVTERHNGAASRVAVDGGAYITGDAGTSLPGGITIAASTAGGLAANIRFYGTVMREGTLTDAQIASVRTLFASKLGVTL